MSCTACMATQDNPRHSRSKRACLQCHSVILCIRGTIPGAIPLLFSWRSGLDRCASRLGPRRVQHVQVQAPCVLDRLSPLLSGLCLWELKLMLYRRLMTVADDCCCWNCIRSLTWTLTLTATNRPGERHGHADEVHNLMTEHVGHV